MERISRYVFAVEALLLAYPTFLGLLLVGGSLLPVVTGAVTRQFIVDAAIGLLVLAGLICAWRLALSFLFYGRARAREVSAPWWVLASAIAMASVLVAAFSRLVAHNTSWAATPFGILEYGVLFVPSFVHLTTEVWLRAV